MFYNTEKEKKASKELKETSCKEDTRFLTQQFLL